MSPSVSLDQMGNTVHASDEKSYIRFNSMANNKNVQNIGPDRFKFFVLQLLAVAATTKKAPTKNQLSCSC
jgi:hypothetical protein